MAKRNSQGFYKRNRIIWVRTDPVTRKALSTGCTDLEAARSWRRERERLAVDPSYGAEKDQGVNHWALKLLALKMRRRSPATVGFYRQKLGHIVRFFGAEAAVSSMLPSRWDDYVSMRQDEGAKNHTIAKEIMVAQQLAKLAARSGVYRGDTRLFKPSDFDTDYEPRERFLTPEELEQLSAVLTPKRVAWVAANIAFAGRFSEVLRAQPEDVDTDQWLVRVRGSKTKRSRATIPIAEPFRGLALVALPFLPLPPWGNMVRDLAAACKRAGIPKVTSNDLRRTHGTWLEELGVPHSTIATVLRHTSERMVRQVYGRARPEKLGQAIQALINATKPLQGGFESVSQSSETHSKAQVAQLVEQRIEKPAVTNPQAPETTRFLDRTVSFGRSLDSVTSGSSRSVRTKNVTRAVTLLDIRDAYESAMRRAEAQ